MFGFGLGLSLRLGIVFWLKVGLISGIGLSLGFAFEFGLYYGSLVIFDICNLQTS